MKIYIKNMVCDRCKMVVKSELEQLGLQPLMVELGEVELKEELKTVQGQRRTRAIRRLDVQVALDGAAGMAGEEQRAALVVVHVRTD